MKQLKTHVNATKVDDVRVDDAKVDDAVSQVGTRCKRKGPRGAPLYRDVGVVEPRQIGTRMKSSEACNSRHRGQ
jgi:hypothetical protein